MPRGSVGCLVIRHMCLCCGIWLAGKACSPVREGSHRLGDLFSSKTTCTTRSETMRGKNQHVMTHEGKWAVQGEGNRRVTSIHETQAAATDRAREIARRQ